jgi:chitinase
MSEPLIAEQEIANVELLVRLVREYGFRGLFDYIGKGNSDALAAYDRLLDSADWLVAHARDLDEQLRQALVNSRDYGG